MQHALRVDGATFPASGQSAESGSNAFVINLLSSTTPVALTRPDHAGLNRFTFFVSRRREDGRERFRLHMGYFDTQEEAEKLLDIVRTIYPGAWAGLAPGRRLGARAGEARPAAAAATVAPAVVAPAAPVAAVPVPESPLLTLVPDAGRRPLTDISERAPQEQAESQEAAASLHSIREAIDSLADASVDPARIGHAEPATPAEVEATRRLPELAPGAIPTLQPPDTAALLSDTATLRLLEKGTPERNAAEPQASTKAAKPPAEAPRNEKPYFAVQLIWSVQPIVLSQVPQLAIFSAYTLYGAEGNRDGRRWYGLRLGFFTDAVSAKQVAQYVRSDFATVSVVPVTEREREQAKQAVMRAGGKSAGAAAPVTEPPKRPAVTAPTLRKEEFEFIDDVKPAKTESTPAAKSAPTSAGRVGLQGRPSRGAPGKRAKLRSPGQVHARTPLKPKTLEETLEILGANQLQVEETAGPPGESDPASMRMEGAKARSSKLSQLFERLSERLGS